MYVYSYIEINSVKGSQFVDSVWLLCMDAGKDCEQCCYVCLYVCVCDFDVLSL